MTATFSTVARTEPAGGTSFATYTNAASGRVQRVLSDWEAKMDSVWHSYTSPASPSTFLNREAEPGGLVMVSFALMNTQVASQLWLQCFDSTVNPTTGVTVPNNVWPIYNGFVQLEFPVPLDFVSGCGTAISTTPGVYNAPASDSGVFIRIFWPRAGT